MVLIVLNILCCVMHSKHRKSTLELSENCTSREQCTSWILMAFILCLSRGFEWYMSKFIGITSSDVFKPYNKQFMSQTCFDASSSLSMYVFTLLNVCLEVSYLIYQFYRLLYLLLSLSGVCWNLSVKIGTLLLYVTFCVWLIAVTSSLTKL
jgi:hypothetical protein